MLRTLSIGLLAAIACAASLAAEIPTDRVIVRLQGASPAVTKSAVDRAAIARRLAAEVGESLEPLRVMGDGSIVMKLPRRMRAAEIRARFAGMRDPEVIEVLPDRVFTPALTPTDPQYGDQWYLGASNGINAPAAWDITTGSSNLVIGIVDTGKLPHAELAARWVGGHDFVSEAFRGNDTDGRDADASDPGDWVTAGEATSDCPQTNSRWHGTAMAGVMAASANNGSGIAGINWSSKLLPVRVVGKCGGYESDIADGIRWAAGGSVPSVIDNANVADVLNVSLSALGGCSTTLQSAVDAALAAGAPVVVAAGNNTLDASGFSPGNCAGVVTVGAVDRNGGMAGYTNFGGAVSVSAPGGKPTEHFVAGDSPSNQWVLTTSNPGTTSPTGDTAHTKFETAGTSIATAQVTGVVSLMLSANPGLAPAAVVEILRNTSRPFPTGTTGSGSQADCTSALCGAGIVDAQAAVRAAAAWGIAQPQVSSGYNGFLALSSDGSVYARRTGFDFGAEITPFDIVEKVAGLSGITSIAKRNANFALRADGTLWAWGNNANAELGDGTQTSRTTPVRVLTPGDIIQVAAGDSHGIALRRDGTVFTWGTNFSGELGNGPGPRQTVPVQVQSLGGVVQVAAGAYQSLALKGDGTVWGWGQGMGNVPAQVAGLPSIQRIASGLQLFPTVKSFALALDASGQVWAWGANATGQLGDGTTVDRATPALVPGLTGVVAIATGHGHALAVKSDGTVWGWGENYAGQLGDGTREPRKSPVLIPGITAPMSISGGADHSSAVLADGVVRYWGALSRDALSTDYVEVVPEPLQSMGTESGSVMHLDRLASGFAAHVHAAPSTQRLSNPVTLASIAPGSSITIAGGEYQLDGGAFTTVPGVAGPGQVLRLRLVSAATCAASTTATATIAGSGKVFEVVTWCDHEPRPVRMPARGSVTAGASVTSAPVTIQGLNSAAPLSVANGTHSVGCTGTYTAAAATIANGQSVCVRASAPLADDTVTTATLTVGQTAIPYRVISATAAGSWVQPDIGGGTFYSIALRSDGSLYSWGTDQGEGRLAQGTIFQATAPLKVQGLSGVKAISVGSRFALAVRSDGTVWGWGLNGSGQLGDGTLNEASSPVMVEGFSGAIAVAAGNQHSLALKADGTVWAWGSGDNGRLGLGDLLRKARPAQVPGLSGIVSIAAGDGHSMALRSDGTVWAWGANLFGALGDGTYGDRWTPVQVPLPPGITAIAAGYAHSLAARSDGSVYAWGWNSKGQLGFGPVGGSVGLPQLVPGTGAVARIAAGFAYSMAITQAGGVLTWGANDSGQLGDGTLTDRAAPGSVSLPLPATAISAGLGFGGQSFALLADGTLVGWGANTGGELGNGNTTPHLLPVPVVDVTGSGNLALDLTRFGSQREVPLSSTRISNAIQLTGFPVGSTISITGGSYSIDGGPFVSDNGVISPGQSVRVQVVAAATCSTTSTATLTIASIQRTFEVSTVSCDGVPNAFTFLSQAPVPLSSLRQSNTVTITGMNVPAGISVSGGEYSLGCNGAFTASPGTIANGQTLCVRQTASASHDTLTTTAVTIGGVLAAFDVITEAAPGFATAAQVSMGYPSLGLRTDGRVVGWGANEEGQLGDGTTIRRYTPVMTQGLSGVVRIANNGHSLAVRSDGTVWSWGNGFWGVLGDGTTTSRSHPARIPGLAGVADIAVGFAHSLALMSDGTVRAWGLNQSGELGDGTRAIRPTPIVVAGLSGVTKIAACDNGSLALKQDGTVWGWGILGGNSPTQIAGLANIVAIAAGEGYGLAVRSDGTVWAWGRNESGQLGVQSPDFVPTPIQVPGLAGIASVAAAGDFNFVHHSLAVGSDGSLWSWGANQKGQLGDGTTAPRSTAQRVAGIQGAALPVVGQDSSLVLLADGTVRAFGWNGFGSLGNGTNGVGTTETQPLPGPVLGINGNGFLRLLVSPLRPDPFALVPVLGSAVAVQVLSAPVIVSGLGPGVQTQVTIAGGEYSIDGAPFTAAAGVVANGQSVVVRLISAATASTTTSATLTIGGASATFHVRTRSDASATRVAPRVMAGDSHTYLLSSDRTVQAAGYNGNGQLGNGTTVGLSTLRPVAGLADALSIASGSFHGLALRADRSVVAWGWNSAGQLGANSPNVAELYPVAVVGLSAVTGISAGRYHSAAVLEDGSAWAWGLNAQGQVGDGSTVASRGVPVRVSGLTSVTAVAAGGRHTLALLADGTVRAWGANESGQLGDGTTTQRNAPVAVSGLSGVLAIAAGDAHSLAIKSDGSVVAWGFNAFGQLGDGTTTSRSVPVQVAALGTGVGIVAAGANHSLAVKVGGALYAWGNNANSQLGNGNNTNQLAPVFLATPAQVVAVAGGARHTVAITAQRKLYAWGDNFFGQVGNRSGNYSPHSASLNVLRGDSVISTGTSASGGGVGTGSNSGSSVLEIENQQAGFDFGSIGPGGSRSIAGKFKNAAPTENVTGVSVSVTGSGFNLAASDCPGTLAPNQECGFTIGFNPASSASYSGELVVQSSVVGSPERRSLSGTAVAATAAVSLGQPGVDFPPQTVWTVASANVTLTNTGTASLTVTAVTSTLGDFSATHDCTNVAPGAACTLQVAFAPIAASSRIGQLSVVSNAAASPHALTVSGTGAASAAAPPSVLLTVAKVGGGGGTVAATNPASPPLDCGATCSASYVAGTVVTLTATPAAGSLFAGWSGPCTGTGSCVVTMNQAKTVTAAFGLPGTFALNVVKAGTGSGTVASTAPASPSIDCGATCIQTFTDGTVVTLSATPAAGSTFDGWAGACSGTGPCQVTMSAARSVTATFTLANPPRLGNISTRMQVLTGNDVMIGGFVIGGSANKTVVVRARGPSLIPFGITNALPNPQLQLVRSSDQQQVAANDDWQAASNAADLTASGFAPSDALEAALLVSLPPGAYTAIVSGSGGSTGVGIVEVFEVDGPDVPLLNISTRGQVLTGNDVMIGGFVITGSASQSVVIRARGPSLIPFGITNALPNPQLQLVRSSDQQTIASNDNWGDAANQADILASGFAPSNSLESAILVTLPPGAYTAIVTGAGGGTGVGIVEVFRN